MHTDIESPKSPECRYEVPRGYLKEVSVEDEDGQVKVEKVLFNMVTLREIKGKEEDLLSDEKRPWVERIHKIIGLCITKLEALDDKGNTIHRIEDRFELQRSIDNMLMSDLVVLTLRLRQVSLGDTFQFKLRCPVASCKTMNTRRFDLSTIEVVPTKGDLYSLVRTYEMRNGGEITWTMITGKEERDMDTVIEKAKKDKASQALLARVRDINGEPSSIESLQDLSMYDRTRLRAAFDSEGGVDTDVTVVCTSCGVSIDTQLPISGDSFFTLSETSDD